MKIVSVEQMRQLERRADVAGISYAQMMEAAGKAVADEIARRWDVRERKILVLVGPGNNGGDGLVAARHLHDAGAQVALYLWNHKTESAVAKSQIPTAKPQQEFEQNMNAVRAEDDPDLSQLRAALAASEIVVDALLGTGANRPIEGTLKEILNTVKSQIPKPHPCPARGGRAARAAGTYLQPPISNLQPPTRSHPHTQIVAVDLPSGLNADTGALDPATVPADLTVTFAYPKVGFYKFPAADALGELMIADIGIPPAFAEEIQLDLATNARVKSLLPARPRDGHKGTFGKAILVSGSANYVGAPYLCAAAAARVGAGLVTLATIADVQKIVAASLHEATYLLLPAHEGAISDQASQVLSNGVRDYDALLIGPGLGRAEATQQFVYNLLDGQRNLPPLIVDADGLNILSMRREWWRSLPPQSILTPHAGEFARLSQLSIDEIQADREGCARTYAQEWNQIVLLKGAFTLIAEPNGQVTLLPFANPALATAGSGDVLSGIIAGLLAQGLSTRDAAIAGGYVHARAGEMARHEIGDAGVLAGDLLPRIPRALRTIKEAT